jgi:hypothetical protein
MYLYARANPWGLVDPTGLDPQPELKDAYARMNARGPNGELGQQDAGNVLGAWCAGYCASGAAVPGQLGGVAKQAGLAVVDAAVTGAALTSPVINAIPGLSDKMLSAPPLSDTFKSLEGNTLGEDAAFAGRSALAGGTLGTSEMGIAGANYAATGDGDAFRQSMFGVAVSDALAAAGMKVLGGPNPAVNGDLGSLPSFFKGAPTVETPAVATPGAEADSALAARVKELHSQLDPVAQSQRTTAVVDAEAPNGGSMRVVGQSSRTNSMVSKTIRDAMTMDEMPARGCGHAEVNAINGARNMGLTPKSIAASRPICNNCKSFIKNANVRAVTEFAEPD